MSGRISRRAVLGLGFGSVAWLVSACQSKKLPTPAVEQTPTATGSSGVSDATDALRLERRVLAVYERAIAAAPKHQVNTFKTLHAQHQRHVAALVRSGANDGQVSSSSGIGLSAATIERTSAQVLTRLAEHSKDPSLAALLASVAACHSAHLDILREL